MFLPNCERFRQHCLEYEQEKNKVNQPTEQQYIRSIDQLAAVLAWARPGDLKCLLQVSDSTFMSPNLVPSAAQQEARHATIKAAWKVFFLTVPGMPTDEL